MNGAAWVVFVGVVLAVWTAVSIGVGLFLSRVVRQRDRQVPRPKPGIPALSTAGAQGRCWCEVGPRDPTSGGGEWW